MFRLRRTWPTRRRRRRRLGSYAFRCLGFLCFSLGFLCRRRLEVPMASSPWVPMACLHSLLAMLACIACLQCLLALLACIACLQCFLALLACNASLQCLLALLACSACLQCFLAKLPCIACFASLFRVHAPVSLFDLISIYRMRGLPPPTRLPIFPR